MMEAEREEAEEKVLLSDRHEQHVELGWNKSL